MKPKNVMRRYYIVMGLLVIGVLAILGAIFVTDAPKRADRLTGQAVESANQYVQNYAADKKKLPDAVDESKISPNKPVSYKPVNKFTYMLCATFNAKQGNKSESIIYDQSNYPNAKVQTQKTEIEALKAKEPDAYYIHTEYYSAYQYHEKGYNCFIIENATLRDEEIEPIGPPVQLDDDGSGATVQPYEL